MTDVYEYSVGNVYAAVNPTKADMEPDRHVLHSVFLKKKIFLWDTNWEGKQKGNQPAKSADKVYPQQERSATQSQIRFLGETPDR